VYRNHLHFIPGKPALKNDEEKTKVDSYIDLGRINPKTEYLIHPDYLEQRVNNPYSGYDIGLVRIPQAKVEEIMSYVKNTSNYQ